jgi:crotonobetainyl-CoA:carnitine CoA-transferase CaiB-like acyl-CoA transferase
LDGIRVVDLSRVLAGPQCTALLSDLGADVVKVEAVGSGDESRGWEPSIEGESTAFLSVNRNKRSIAVDLNTSQGRQIVFELILRADVLVESFRTGTMERWGFGYEQIRPRTPRLIYTSISAFGRSGELRNQPGYEAVVQAFSGIMSITGEVDGPPVRSGPSLLDIGTGIVAAHAITAAVLDRKRTGSGQRVESSLFATAITFLGYHAQGYLSAGIRPSRLGSGHPALVPYRAYMCAGGDEVFIAAGNERLWGQFCDALELSSLADDQRFVTVAARQEHRDQLDGLLTEFFASKPRGWVLRRLEAAGVPAAPVNDVAVAVSHPQVKEIGAVQAVYHPGLGRTLDLVASPFQSDTMSTEIRQAPPLLGEHTEAILTELGYGDEKQRELYERGIVG